MWTYVVIVAVIVAFLAAVWAFNRFWSRRDDEAGSVTTDVVSEESERKSPLRDLLDAISHLP